MFFTVTFTDRAGSSRNYNMAWVQWYESFGGPRDGSDRLHVDPDFPPALIDHFPRLYLPEYDLDAQFDVILVRDIIAPAPICPDLSLMHYSPADEAAAREPAQRAGSRQRQQQRREERQRLLQQEPNLNHPFIPSKFRCPTKGCRRKRCTMLHPKQFAGADMDRTHLKVVNLLHFEMSRGVWNPVWVSAPPPPTPHPYDMSYDMYAGEGGGGASSYDMMTERGGAGLISQS